MVTTTATLAEAQAVLETADRLFSREDVERAMDELASELTARLSETNPILMCVMNGGVVPTGHLMTRVEFPLQLDYVHATRYRQHTTGGELHWLARPHIDLQDRVVLVVDDILDEGMTLAAIMDFCRAQGAAEVYSAVLVDKMRQRPCGIPHADFTGLRCEDRYVFGYGMDYKGFLRNAPGIFAVKDD